VGHRKNPEPAATIPRRPQTTVRMGTTGLDYCTTILRTKILPTSRPHRPYLHFYPPAASLTIELLTFWPRLTRRMQVIIKITRKRCICISRIRGALKGPAAYSGKSNTLTIVMPIPIDPAPIEKGTQRHRRFR
jgi:hypothetical protein